jgi:fructose 1,6-bisphosphate aldolase/phosphatase
MANLITLSVIKADVGGYVGHSSVHPALLEGAREHVSLAMEKKLLIDGYVTHCGDDLELIMTHRKGVDNAEIHKFAWDTFVACTGIAKRLKLYGAGQDLLSDAFAGTVRGMGPGVAEMAFEERPSEPVVVFMADKTSPGGWNLPLFQIYANPFNTAGLVIDPSMHKGFEFEMLDVFEKRSIRFVCPEDMYELLMFIGATRRYMVKYIYRRQDGQIVASASTQKLSLNCGEICGQGRSRSDYPLPVGVPRAWRDARALHFSAPRRGVDARFASRAAHARQPVPSHSIALRWSTPRDRCRISIERRQAPRSSRSV